MENVLRGRPRLDLDIKEILEAVRRHGQVLAAARELGCSDAYIHVRLRREGLSLREVVDGIMRSAAKGRRTRQS